ncbi:MULTISPECIES: hypothetical protein [unclassified Streptomyces]|uniref:hypothetical protein n=1 Tax=unclassified Streptomyces TaxID=2593676 RepID=UPI00381F1790
MGELSGDPLRRIGQFGTAGVHARLRLFEVLATAGVPAPEADELVGALEAGAVAAAYSWVSELVDFVPDGHDDAYGQGWLDAGETFTGCLVERADRIWEEHCRAVRSAGFTAHLAEAREKETGELVRLRAFARQALDGSLPGSEEHRRAVEALGAAGDGLTDGGPADAAAVSAGQAAVAEDPLAAVEAVYVERVLAVVERLYRELTGRSKWDREVSLRTLAVVLRCVSAGELAGYPERLARFVRAHRGRFTRLYLAYGPQGPYPDEVCLLAARPEGIVFCERLTAAPFRLEGIWDPGGRGRRSRTPASGLADQRVKRPRPTPETHMCNRPVQQRSAP